MNVIKHKTIWIGLLFITSIISIALLNTKTEHHSNPHQLINLKKIKKLSRKPIYIVSIINEYKQKQPTFVQGIVKKEDLIYTSSGQYGASFIRESLLSNGKIKKQIKLDNNLFAEGITIFKHKLYQIFWKAQKGYTYNVNTLNKVGEFHYKGEGWGLTHNQHDLIMSNGTSTLSFLDPKHQFRVEKKLIVHAAWGEIDNLNSIFYQNNIIFANIWHTDIIAMISAKSGSVIGWINITRLYPGQKNLGMQCRAANGITSGKTTNELIITGKCWKKLYEINY